MDSILILVEDSYYVAQYDALLDCIVDIQQVPLADITRIEFGQLEGAPAPTSNTAFSLGFLGGSGQKPRENHLQQSSHCVRFQYDGTGTGSAGVDGGPCAHMFRSTGFRFFNNVVVPLASEEERVESLKALADAVAVAIEASGRVPDMWFGLLERRKLAEEISPLGAPPSASDPSPVRSGRLRNVGVAAALSNVSSQISRFNPIGKLMRPPANQTPAASDEIRFTDLQSTACDGENDDDSRFNTCGDEMLEGDGGGLHIQNIDRMSALYSPGSRSTAPPSIQITSNSYTATKERPTTTSDVRRQRKISRSSENLTADLLDDHHPIDTVLVPFAMLSQGLQSLGSNLVDSNKLLSRSCEQFMSLGDLNARERSSDTFAVGSRPLGQASKSPALDDRLTRVAKSPACQSLVLNI
jgi:hypothetical protein